VLERTASWAGLLEHAVILPSDLAHSTTKSWLDGAHEIIADCYQALNDVGFTLAANGSVYWNANLEQPSDYKDLSEVSLPAASMMQTAAANGVHLAAMLATNATRRCPHRENNEW
jgi:hypothetical protein